MVEDVDEADRAERRRTIATPEQAADYVMRLKEDEQNERELEKRASRI